MSKSVYFHSPSAVTSGKHAYAGVFSQPFSAVETENPGSSGAGKRNSIHYRSFALARVAHIRNKPFRNFAAKKFTSRMRTEKLREKILTPFQVIVPRSRDYDSVLVEYHTLLDKKYSSGLSRSEKSKLVVLKKELDQFSKLRFAHLSKQREHQDLNEALKVLQDFNTKMTSRL